MPAMRLFFEEPVFSGNLVKDLAILLRSKSYGWQEDRDSLQQFWLREVTLTLLMKVPGDFFEQLPFMFWFECAQATNIATGIPFGEEGIPALLVEFLAPFRE